jgi:hypothetical protein
MAGRGSVSPSPFVIADWLLGDDDPGRPHPLRVVSPNARLEEVMAETESQSLLRRREQALFERRAAEGGFVMVTFSGARWFSRTPVLLTTPERTILRYDHRASASFDDASRADLTRETKQVLSFLAAAAALSRGDGGRAAPGRFEALDQTLHEVLGALLEDAGIRYHGVEPATLEPRFETADGRSADFDSLPRSARHLVAFGALTLRALAGGYPGKDARAAEGVVLIDDVEAQQDLRRDRSIAALLGRALPRVQWIMTTSSPAAALRCDLAEVIALRRACSGRIEVHAGREAVMH